MGNRLLSAPRSGREIRRRNSHTTSRAVLRRDERAGRHGAAPEKGLSQKGFGDRWAAPTAARASA
jgi:hypothetical protein